jgi:hypothetical protein
MLTAIEKVRQQLTGDPDGNPHYQHEGPSVVRWITGGTAPSVYVVFQHRGNEVVACCPHCRQEFGRFGADYGGATSRHLGAVRETGHIHSCQESM